ncbi:MAG: hypothetical protein JWL98_433, partial [Xanthomonadaceae bacterium]|nr:hypothetical protein [Xanthomonadaceae bacterium]
DVYINGGPTKSPCQAGKIEYGNYIFQVTIPSGATMLSTDVITDRGFSVLNGIIYGYSGPHGQSVGPCGSDTVQLIPYDDTPNAGGVYKVWVTRQTDYYANGNKFVPGSTKTDNFRIKPSIVAETGTINAYKFYDKNANGVWDNDEVPLANWLMALSPGTSKLTTIDGLAPYANIAAGTYSVTEGHGSGAWVQSGSSVDGIPTANSPEQTIANLVLAGGETINVEFGNYCTCGGGRTLTFWSGAAGQLKLADGTGMNPEFSLMNGLNLRTATGANFALPVASPEATNYTALQSWLLGATDTNMAYLLSAQLAALRLSVEAGYVSTSNFYKPFGGTIAQLITTANALLSSGVCGTTCNTAAASQLRTDQETVKTYLEQINGGALTVKSTPCAFKFTLPVS